MTVTYLRNNRTVSWPWFEHATEVWPIHYVHVACRFCCISTTCIHNIDWMDTHINKLFDQRCKKSKRLPRCEPHHRRETAKLSSLYQPNPDSLLTEAVCSSRNQSTSRNMSPPSGPQLHSLVYPGWKGSYLPRTGVGSTRQSAGSSGGSYRSSIPGTALEQMHLAITTSICSLTPRVTLPAGRPPAINQWRDAIQMWPRWPNPVDRSRITLINRTDHNIPNTWICVLSQCSHSPSTLDNNLTSTHLSSDLRLMAISLHIVCGLLFSSYIAPVKRILRWSSEIFNAKCMQANSRRSRLRLSVHYSVACSSFTFSSQLSL